MGDMQNRRDISCVNLVLTDRCNRACPECCCDVPRIKEPWSASWLALEAAAEHIRGIERVQLTGGEPSMHPQFRMWVPEMRKLFDCKKLTVETNGFLFKRHPSLFSLFDEVLFTHYAPPEFAEDNIGDFNFLQPFLRALGAKTILHCIPISHVSRERRGAGTCARGSSETVAIYKGRVFPCCMGWGIPGATSCELSAVWREDVTALKLPCRECFFAGS